jgi:hypothetical protein
MQGDETRPTQMYECCGVFVGEVWNGFDRLELKGDEMACVRQVLFIVLLDRP